MRIFLVWTLFPGETQEHRFPLHGVWQSCGEVGTEPAGEAHHGHGKSLAGTILFSWPVESYRGEL